MRFWDATPMPADFERQHTLWTQFQTDMTAVLDQLELVTAALLEARAQTKGFQ
jgi:hypothetical protein